MFIKFANTLKLLVLLFIFPVIAIITSNLLINKVDNVLQTSLLGTEISEQDKILYTSENFCRPHVIQELRSNKDFVEVANAINDICEETNYIHDMKYYGITAINVSVVLFLGLFAAVWFSKKHRLLLLFIFRIGMLVLPLVMVALIILEAVLMIEVLYFGQSYLMDRVFVKPIMIIGAIAAFSSIRMVIIILQKLVSTQTIVGYAISKKEQSKIWKFVEQIATQMQTTIPDNIVLGLGTSYYVTQSKIKCLSGEYTGKTLFLSLSLLKILTKDELKSVIVHELAHFKGKDTLYTLYFYPAWAKLNAYIDELDAYDSLFLMPFVSFLNYFRDLFEEVEAKFSREREQVADLMAAKEVSSLDCATALGKIHFYSVYWRITDDQISDIVRDDKSVKNKNQIFDSIISSIDVKNIDVEDFINKSKINHPTDSHPTLMQRLEYLLVDWEKVKKSITQEPKKSIASSLIEDQVKLEEDLSLAEQYLLYKRIENARMAALKQDS